MAIQVVAIAVGFFGKLREVGDEFSIQNKNQLGKWMKIVGEANDEPETGKTDGPMNAKDTIAAIKDSDDIEFLNEQLKDERATVKRAAEERMAELSAG